MYKESKKVLVIGLALSVVCWWMITEAIAAGTFTFIYSPVVVGAFIGAMAVLVGIQNSMSQSDDEYEAAQPWAMKYKPRKSYFRQSQFAHQTHNARQGGVNRGDQHV
jgi:hypothetical protein